MAKITIDLDAITADMDTLKDEKARLSFELKNVEKEIEKRELQLVTALQQADVRTMEYGVYYYGWKTTKRKAFDQKLFKEKQPDLFNQYFIEKESEKFEFKINK